MRIVMFPSFGFNLIAFLAIVMSSCSNYPKAQELGLKVEQLPVNDEEIFVAGPMIDQGAAIADGALSHQYPAVVALLNLNTSDRTQIQWCTGTIIGCGWVLTAAHCIEEIKEDSLVVFAQHGGFFGTEIPILHPDWPGTKIDANKRDKESPIDDLALLPLKSTVDLIQPMGLYQGSAIQPGDKGTIVGFGDNNLKGFGQKLVGRSNVDSCRNGYPLDTSDRTHICSRYEPSDLPGSEASTTCFGDSGGPMIARTESDQDEITGIASGGYSLTCGRRDAAHHVRLTSTHRDWIRSFVGAGLDDSGCGNKETTNTRERRILGTALHLSTSNKQVNHTLLVPAKVENLIIALNGYVDRRNPADRLGRDKVPPADTFDEFRGLSMIAWSEEAAGKGSVADCQGLSIGLYSTCKVSKPRSGRWVVAVQPHGLEELGGQTFGYQITATILVD